MPSCLRAYYELKSAYTLISHADMEKDYEECLRELHKHPYFEELRRELEHNPILYVPEFKPGANPQDWIYSSGMKRGYLIALNIFGIDIDD